MIRRALVLATTDWKIALRDKRALLWMLFMPLLFTFVFGSVFRGSEGAAKRREIPVVVEDERFLGEAFAAMLEDENWAVRRVARGDSLLAGASARIEVPPAFTDSVLGGGDGAVRVVERSGGSPERAEAYRVNAWKASIRALSILQEIPDTVLAAGDARIRPVYDSLAALSPLVALEVRDAAEIRHRPAGYLLSVPGNLVMFVLIVALTGGAATVAADATRGNLRRLGSSPLTRFEVFLGKLLGNTLVALTQIAFLVAASALLFRMDWGRDPIALVLLLGLYAIVASSIGVFLGLSVRRPETAAAAGVLVTLVFSALGGCWWPLEVVPDAMRAAGHVFPTAWAMDGLLDLVAYERGLAATAPELLVLAGYALVFAFAGSRLVRFDR